MASILRDVTGFRGEKIVELCLTDYQHFPQPLFRPGFLGDKWPAIDFYVELSAITTERFFFFTQIKSTSSRLSPKSTQLRVTATKDDIDRLLRIPGPTYILGVHEPSKRVFARSVHSGIPVKAITAIPVAYELTSTNLQKPHDEVRDFWLNNNRKPTSSVFA